MSNSTNNIISPASESDSTADTTPEIEINDSVSFEKDKIKSQTSVNAIQHFAPDLTASANITQTNTIDATGFATGIAATAAGAEGSFGSCCGSL